MCWAPPRSAIESEGCRIVASGDYKDVADPTCAPFELVPCDVFITEATFGLPVFRHGDPDAEIAKLLASVALFPERAPSGRRLFARQGAARHRADPRGRLRRADLSARRDGDDHRATTRAASTLGELRRGARCRQGRSRRRHRAVPAVGAAGPLDAPLSRSGHGVRVGLDAGAGARPPARRRAAAGDLRPLRLGRPHRHHRRHRRRRHLGDPRRRGCAGALVPDARPRAPGRCT